MISEVNDYISKIKKIKTFIVSGGFSNGIKTILEYDFDSEEEAKRLKEDIQPINLKQKELFFKKEIGLETKDDNNYLYKEIKQLSDLGIYIPFLSYTEKFTKTLELSCDKFLQNGQKQTFVFLMKGGDRNELNISYFKDPNPKKGETIDDTIVCHTNQSEILKTVPNNIILVSPTIYNNVIENFKNQADIRKKINDLNKKQISLGDYRQILKTLLARPQNFFYNERNKSKTPMPCMYFPKSYYVDFYLSKNQKSDKDLFLNQIKLKSSIDNSSIFNSKYEDLNNKLKKVKPKSNETKIKFSKYLARLSELAEDNTFIIILPAYNKNKPTSTNSQKSEQVRYVYKTMYAFAHQISFMNQHLYYNTIQKSLNCTDVKEKTVLNIKINIDSNSDKNFNIYHGIKF